MRHELDHFVMFVVDAIRTTGQVEAINHLCAFHAVPDFGNGMLVHIADATRWIGAFLSAKIHRSISVDHGLHRLEVTARISTHLERMVFKDPVHDVDVESLIRQINRAIDRMQHLFVQSFIDRKP